jgi:probable HAF family extracellular repeat protein
MKIMKHMRARQAASLGLALAAWGNAIPANAEVLYTVTNLGLLRGTPDDNRPDRAQGINNRGDVVGSSYPSGTGATGKGFVYYGADGRLINLGTLAGDTAAGASSTAYDISDNGWVVATNGSNAFAWSDDNGDRTAQTSELRGLGTPTNGTNAVPRSINNAGQVAGYTNTGISAAWRWQSNQFVVINSGVATGINDAGQVVGSLSGAAWRWTDTDNDNAADSAEIATISKTIFGGSSSTATGINSSGQVVGYAKNADGDGRGFVWTDADSDNVVQASEVVDLGFPAGGNAFANAINDSGAVVGGFAAGSSRYAFVWTPSGGPLNLNDVIDPTAGISLNQAQAINNAGQIVGFGKLTSGGTSEYAFLLTPVSVPEPASLLLFVVSAAMTVAQRRGNVR